MSIEGALIIIGKWSSAGSLVYVLVTSEVFLGSVDYRSIESFDYKKLFKSDFRIAIESLDITYRAINSS